MFIISLIVFLMFSILAIFYIVIFNKNKTITKITKKDCIEDFLDTHVIFSNA